MVRLIIILLAREFADDIKALEKITWRKHHPVEDIGSISNCKVYEYNDIKTTSYECGGDDYVFFVAHGSDKNTKLYRTI